MVKKTVSVGFRFFSGLLFLTLLVSGLGVVSAQTVVQCYVKWDAGGANSGASWADAYTDLQSALGGSLCTEIWVAAGTYKPTATPTLRTATFQLKNGVAIYGGFAGTEQSTEFNLRNPTTNRTILSGDIDDNDTQKPVITDITTVTGNTTNSTRVVTGATGAILDGFIITAGYSTSNGAGMYNSSSSPTLENVTFSGNTATSGAGMYNTVGSPTLTNVKFSSNIASGNGGGMYNTGGSIPILTHVTFSGNTATNGGGMLNLNSSPTLSKVLFSGNTATTGAGGGIYSDGSSATLTNVIFHSNRALASGGGGMYSIRCSQSLTNVTFNANTASTIGGGMFNNSTGNPTIRNAIFWGNTPDQIRNNISIPILSDSVIQNGYASGTNVITSDPLLGSLGDYGGLTQTIPLLPGSSAIDTGNATYCTAGSDQRGESYLNGCDIGAFEAQGFTFSNLTGTPQRAQINSSFLTQLGLTVTANHPGDPVDGGKITFTWPPSDASLTSIANNPALISGGSVLSGSVLSNATVGGPYNVTASASGASSVNFSLTNTLLPAPQVTIDQAVGQADPTRNTPINFNVVFSQPVTGFISGDVTLSGSAGATTDTVTEIAPNDGTTYNVAVSGMTGGGSVIATIEAGKATNSETTPNIASTSTDNTLTYDPPVLNAFTRQDPAASPTNADTLVFRATFDSDMQNVDTTDFSPNGTTATVTNVTTVSDAIYDVTVSGGNLAALNGTVGLDLAGGQNITDLAGNPLPASEPVTDQTYTMDNTAPTISVSAPSATLTADGPVTYTVTYADTNFDSITLAIGDITLNKTGTADGTLGVSGTGLTRSVTIGSIIGDGTLSISIASGTASDLADNTAPAAGPSTDFTADNTAPTIIISVPSAEFTADGPVTYTVTYADANFDSISLATGDITLNKTATADGTLGVSGTGLTRSVTISSITGDGTLSISIASDTASDLAGQAAPAAGPSTAFTADHTAPLVTGFSVTTPSNKLNIPITTFTASGGATGYMITETATSPTAETGGWTADAPATFTVASKGSYTLYPWAKDASGNVSAVYGSGIPVVVDTTAAPVITFDNPPTPIFLGGDFTVHATTTNTDSDVLTYSRVSGPCAWVSGATFKSTGAGVCVVQAASVKTENFFAASQTQNVTIGRAAHELFFPFMETR